METSLAEETRMRESAQHRSLRVIGLLPIFFFLAQASHYWRIGELGNMLWICNIGNLVLGIGLLANRPVLIRIAALWMIPGLVVWFVYVVLAWGVFFTSTLAHVGGLIVSIFAIQRVGMDRRSWFYALLWYFAVQFLSRIFTPVVLNVNLSQTVEVGWQKTFTAYWKFWLVLTIIVAIILWTLGWALSALWPTKRVRALSLAES